MKHNNQTTNTTLVNQDPQPSLLKKLVKPLHITVEPEFKDAATEVAQKTKAGVVAGTEKTKAFTKLIGRKAGAAIQAMKETK